MPDQPSFSAWRENHLYYDGWTAEGNYTIPHLATLLGCGRRTVAYWVAHKRCPAWAEDRITALAEQGAFVAHKKAV